MIDDTVTAADGDDALTLADLEAFAAALADGPDASRVIDQVYARHVAVAFDWTTWQAEAQRFLAPDVVATASLDEVRRLLTLHVRKERFCEGHLDAVIASGHLAALAARLAVLAAELRAGAGRTRLRVEQGDITKVAADALVNAANSALSGGGGVDGAIHRAAGPELLAACRALGRCPTGQARVTPGFRLPARWVIHAVGPVWDGGGKAEARLLAEAYRASLALARARGCRTVAFPAISCGAYGYPIDAACAIAVATIRSWCDVHPGLDEVILVAYERPVAAALARALG